MSFCPPSPDSSKKKKDGEIKTGGRKRLVSCPPNCWNEVRCYDVVNLRTGNHPHQREFNGPKVVRDRAAAALHFPLRFIRFSIDKTKTNIENCHATRAIWPEYEYCVVAKSTSAGGFPRLNCEIKIRLPT